MARQLRILYLLEDTALFGGVKVVLQQARLLHRRGHAVTIASPGAPPAWFGDEDGEGRGARFIQTTGLGPHELPPADVVVATFWTTLAHAHAAVARHGGVVLHYCQGFEGSNLHNRADHAAIDAAYAQPAPAMAVSPHLVRLLHERFDRPARLVPPPLDDAFRPARRLRRRPRRRPRVLVTAPYRIYLKGVKTALEAVARLRASGTDVALVRLAQWPATDDERAITPIDAYHHEIAPADVPALVRGCDLLLCPSWPQEGFGLAVLEAFGCGVP
ncbi:MAG: glycosyltransferase family 4 protein, partial [Acidobacteriota bacterium]